MGHILTNYPPKAKSECPQLNIPVSIEHRQYFIMPYIIQRWYGATMRVIFESRMVHPDASPRDKNYNLVAVWRLKELKPIRMTFNG